MNFIYEVEYDDGQRGQCKQFTDLKEAERFAQLVLGIIYKVMPEVRIRLERVEDL